MDLQNFKASIEDPRVYTLVINGMLSPCMISGRVIADEIAYLDRCYKENKSIKRIDIEINSEGGSIIEGIKVASEMLSAEIPIRTINKGYACSMSGVIFISGRERQMVDFGLTMIHNPQFQGQDLREIEDGKHKEAMKRMKGQLMSLIIKRTGIDEEKLAKMMDDETWLTANECKKMNFTDEIIKYPNAPIMGENTKENILQLTEYYNSLNVKQKKEIKMDEKHYENILKEKDVSIENLKNDVSKRDGQIEELTLKYDNVSKEKESLEEKLQAVNNELTEANVKIQGYKDKEAETAVSNVIEKGLFKETDKDTLLEMAKKDTETFNKYVSLIQIPEKKPEKISTLIEMSNTITNLKEDELKGLTRFEHMQKNDPGQLLKIKNTSPGLYAAMEKEFIDSKKDKN